MSQRQGSPSKDHLKKNRKEARSHLVSVLQSSGLEQLGPDPGEGSSQIVSFSVVSAKETAMASEKTEEPKVSRSRTVTITCRVMDEVLGEHSGYPET